MRNLDEVPAAGFHAVICMDNALPHLLNEADLTQAAGQIRAKLRVGGTFLASIRDYDAILAQPPVVQGPAFYSDEGKRRIVFQVWDWQDERRYVFHMYITRETSAGWANLPRGVGVSSGLARRDRGHSGLARIHKYSLAVPGGERILPTNRDRDCDGIRPPTMIS